MEGTTATVARETGTGRASSAPQPRVSAIVPTRGRPELVRRAVGSALAQTMSDLEVVVVVDGPNLETVRSVLALNDPRVRIVELREPVGLGGALNAGALAARAPWVALLDDDDEWLPDKLERQLPAAERSRARYPCVATRFVFRTDYGDLIWPRRRPDGCRPFSEYLFSQTDLFGGGGLILPSTILTRRDLLLTVPFRPGLPRHNDLDWLLRIACVEGVEITVLAGPAPLAVWHVDERRPRISRSPDWRFSLAWAFESRSMMTSRAYASFLLSSVSMTAARAGAWSQFVALPMRALREGSPTFIDFGVHAVIWLIPRSLRTYVARLRARAVTLVRHRTSGDRTTPAADAPTP